MSQCGRGPDARVPDFHEWLVCSECRCPEADFGLRHEQRADRATIESGPSTWALVGFCRQEQPSAPFPSRGTL
jgi:hypothetical protein